MRRGAARHEVSERVSLRTATGQVYDGWALNVSRGGFRAILEDKLELGQEFTVVLSGSEGLERHARIVWVQDEPDGAVVGLEFVDASGLVRSGPPSRPPGALHLNEKLERKPD
jgi:hypothetical protein